MPGLHQSALAALRRKRRPTCLLQMLLFLMWTLGVAGAPGAQHIPLVRRQHLGRRSSPQALADWAVLERERIRVKYDALGDGNEASKPTPLLRARQTGSPGGADASSASLSALFASESAQLSSRVAIASASAISSVGQVELTNFQSDLCVITLNLLNARSSIALREYYAPLYIGTPSQAYNVILDTGSADLWLASANCTTTQCGSVPRFNPSNSSSLRDLGTAFNVRYGFGSASGTLYSDNVTLANRNLSAQTFAVCDQVTTSLLSGNVTGLMGLGFQPLAASGLKPMWQNLLDADVANNSTNTTFPGFAFALTRFVNVTGASLNEFGGIFSIGTLSNASFTGNISFIDIPSNLESYWLIPMDAVVFNGTDLPNVGTPNAAIDTGTTLVGGPQSIISNLYSQIPGSLAASGQYAGYYIFPCNSTVPLGLTFGGITYNLTSADVNLGLFRSATTTSPAMCLGSFFDLTLSAGSSSVISWVIGDAFLKNVYSVYRYLPTPAVGFAALSDNFTSISPDVPLALQPSHMAASVSIGIFPTATGTSTIGATTAQDRQLTATLNATSSAAPTTCWQTVTALLTGTLLFSAMYS